MKASHAIQNTELGSYFRSLVLLNLSSEPSPACISVARQPAPLVPTTSAVTYLATNTGGRCLTTVIFEAGYEIGPIVALLSLVSMAESSKDGEILSPRFKNDA